jgi:hypothetical protein
MISCDTNILLHAYNASSSSYEAAKEFLRCYAADEQFAICELVLIGLYVLLRNPAVVAKPLSPGKAVVVCRRYRQNRVWNPLEQSSVLPAPRKDGQPDPCRPRRGVAGLARLSSFKGYPECRLDPTKILRGSRTLSYLADRKQRVCRILRCPQAEQ